MAEDPKTKPADATDEQDAAEVVDELDLLSDEDLADASGGIRWAGIRQPAIRQPKIGIRQPSLNEQRLGIRVGDNWLKK